MFVLFFSSCMFTIYALRPGTGYAPISQVYACVLVYVSPTYSWLTVLRLCLSLHPRGSVLSPTVSPFGDPRSRPCIMPFCFVSLCGHVCRELLIECRIYQKGTLNIRLLTYLGKWRWCEIWVSSVFLLAWNEMKWNLFMGDFFILHTTQISSSGIHDSRC